MINHIAFIMDGNRRYNYKIFKNPFKNYNKSIDNIHDQIIFCLQNKIENISFYVFSKENWNRSEFEIKHILKELMNFTNSFVYRDNIYQKHEKKYNKKGFSLLDLKLNFLYSNNKLPKEIIQNFTKINQIHNKKRKKKINCNFLVSYSGREDIVNVFNKYKILYKTKKINEKTFNNLLLTKNIPDPNIIIRTGGFKRLSGYLTYESTYSELYFLNKLWPEIKVRDTKKLIKKYNKTKKNFGS